MLADKACAVRRSVEDDDDLWTGVEEYGGREMEEERFGGNQAVSRSTSAEWSTHFADQERDCYAQTSVFPIDPRPLLPCNF